MSGVADPLAAADQERILVLAPRGRDSAIAAELLGEAGLSARPCDGLDDLLHALTAGAGSVIMTQEALQTADLHPLLAWLRAQPPWSDLPLIILTSHDVGHGRNPKALPLARALGNVTYLERPFHPETLLSMVQSALRSRRRQYQARGQLAELLRREQSLREGEDRYRTLAASLEQEVAERTQRLRVNERRLRAIFQTGYQAQALLTVDGTVLDANATSLMLIAADPRDVVGQAFWQTPWFTGTAGMPEIVRAAVAAAARGESVRRELTIDVVAGRRILDFSIRPIHDDSGDVVAIVTEAADITDRRHAEAALRQAQKMEAIGQLTGGIAHDFNNMLQSIGGGVELMRKRISSGRPEDALRFVDAAGQSVDRAAALTHRLLAFSRRQALAPKRVVLDELMQGIVGLIQRTVGPQLNVEMVLADGQWPVRCDPNQLENALLNLAINARDAMLPDGGDLLVQTAHVALGAADVGGWHDARPGDYVRISVTDTGGGMPPDVLEHAFEPFFTTKPTGQGTGLGLSQVFGFVSQSNGMMRIDSRVGAGTSVHLFLPRHPDTAVETAPQVEIRGEAGSLATATVLLVEDEAAIRHFAAEALREFGCRVVEAKDGPGGLSALRDLLRGREKAIDILVADVGLPGGLNGRQLADAARELLPTLPVLLITGYVGEAFGPNRMQLTQRMELLNKPFTLDALTRRVGEMLGVR